MFYSIVILNNTHSCTCTYIQSIDFRVGRGESMGRVCYLSAG